MKIYSKTGDDGTTGLVGGGRLAKSELRIQAIGDVDELNAHIGECRRRAAGGPLEFRLAEIQHRLFDLGAELACEPEGRIQLAKLEDASIRTLEASIDEQVSELEPLRNFILPGGCELSCGLHLARCVCRRAERAVVTLDASANVRPVILEYLNRLSDWLFIAARTANRLANVEDIKWNSEP